MPSIQLKMDKGFGNKQEEIDKPANNFQALF